MTPSVGTPLTEEKLAVHLESVKDLIVSTAKGTEAALRKEIHDVRVRVDRCEVVLSEHSKELKQLDIKIDGVRTELKGDIQGLRTELKGEMHQMEKRLSDKIDGNATRFDDHENRIAALKRSA